MKNTIQTIRQCIITQNHIQEIARNAFLSIKNAFELGLARSLGLADNERRW
jgi:hypothetical protein